MNKKPQVRNTQITDQLATLLNKKPKTDIKKSKKPKEHFHNKEVDLQSWKADGEDHINICGEANTIIGKFLCHDTTHGWRHPILGNFNSIRGFWYYIQSTNHDDRYRRLVGKHLRMAHNPANTVRILNFRAILMDACWQRLIQSDAICKLVKESELPFDCYFIHFESKLRVRPTYHSWVTSATEEMRKALKENREPDFAYLMEDTSVELYSSITPDYLKRLPVEEVDVHSPVEADGVDTEEETVYEAEPSSQA